MSIDKESSGFPEVNVHRSATKVNLWMIAGLVIFLGAAAAAAIWVSRDAKAASAVSSNHP